MSAGGLRYCGVWHRRAGKDEAVLRWTFKAAHQRIGNYWHMLPQAAQARKAIWDAINPHTGVRRIDECFPLETRRRTLNNDMKIEFLKGSTWQVVGSDNYNALVGSPPIGCVFSEWSLADPHAWAYMRPILRENGGWAIFIYTPRGQNHGLSLYKSAQKAPGWLAETYPVSKTGLFTPAELAIELLEYQQEFGEELGTAIYEQEFDCSFDAAVLGAIYAKWIRMLEADNRAGPSSVVPYDPAFVVHTAWDIGYGDATAVWFFQIIRNELHIIDCMTATGEEAQYYASALAGRRLALDPTSKKVTTSSLSAEMARRHAHRKAYAYGRHYAPHDAVAKTIASGGRSFKDQMYDYGYMLDVVPAISQEAQISGARRTLESCYFDGHRCEKGLDALRSYHREWDDKLKVLKEEPLHDWSSHYADALEVIGQVWQPIKAAEKPKKPVFLHQVTADKVFFPKGLGKKI